MALFIFFPASAPARRVPFRLYCRRLFFRVLEHASYPFEQTHDSSEINTIALLYRLPLYQNKALFSIIELTTILIDMVIAGGSIKREKSDVVFCGNATPQKQVHHEKRHRHCRSSFTYAHSSSKQSVLSSITMLSQNSAILSSGTPMLRSTPIKRLRWNTARTVVPALSAVSAA